MRLHLLAPLSGDIRAMEDVPDPVFSASMVGPGFAIDPFAGGLTVVSPCRGVVRQAKPHGIVIEALGDHGEVSESDDGGRGVRGAVGSAGGEFGRPAPAEIQETDAARSGTRLKELGNDAGEPGGETAARAAGAAGAGTDAAGAETDAASPGTHSAGVGTLNVIVHLGLDTVHLAGEGFTVLVSPGDCVSAGQPLVLWNTSVAQRAGYSLCTPVVAVGAQQKDLRLLAEGRVEAGKPFFAVQ